MAERVLAAEKQGRRIAVEVESFLSASPLNDLEKALGQFLRHQSILKRREPDRMLFPAVPQDVAGVFVDPLGQLRLEDYAVQVLVFDPVKEEIVRWIP